MEAVNYHWEIDMLFFRFMDQPFLLKLFGEIVNIGKYNAMHDEIL